MMVAQLIVIHRNGYFEAHDPSLRDSYEIVVVDKEEKIKPTIWGHLKKLGRNGSVLVKYNDRMFICEMKQSKRGYTKVEINYHPYQSKFQ